jgi:hypothetical protein
MLSIALHCCVGVVLSACGDCNVLNVFATGFTDYGIRLTASSFLCEVMGCKTAGNGQVGVQLDVRYRHFPSASAPTL